MGGKTTAHFDTTFGRRYRLLESSEFDRIFREGQRSIDPYFTVLYCSNELDHPRLGMVMARKRVSRSVDRNRLKRLVRESFRRTLQQLGSLDLVVIAKSHAVDAANATVFQSLANHWRRVRQASSDG